MPQDWQIEQAIRLIRMVKFLIARADDKGMTHGEKHHIHQTLGILLDETLDALGAERSITERHLPIDAPSDIPF